MRFGTMRVSQSEAQSHQDCDLQSAARLLDEGIVETLVSADAISRTRVACMCDIGASRRGGNRCRCSSCVELRTPPTAAVRESLAILRHEINVMQSARHRYGKALRIFCLVPVDLRHLGAVGDVLAVAGKAGLVSRD